MWWCAVALAATGLTTSTGTTSTGSTALTGTTGVTTDTPDLTWESPPQPVPVHGEAPIFTGPLVDTGWWPSSTDPIAVRFHITPSGMLFTDIDADSELAWPNPLWHRVVPIPETGRIEADAALDIEAELQLDIFGLYSGVVDLWTRSFDMEGAADFDGMLLDGDPVREVDVDVQGDSQEVVDFSLQIFPGLDVVAAIDVAPEVELVVSDGEIVSEVGEATLLQTVTERWGAIDYPTVPQPAMDTAVTWSSFIDAALNVVFTPTIELDTFLGDFELFALPLDVNVIEVAERRDADVAEALHPLPGMALVSTGLDFGEVLLGQERTLQLPVSNLGDLLLEGQVVVQGDGAFTVFPDTLIARSEETDGLSITYTPSGLNPQAAELVLITNDPLQPVVRLPLTGAGYDAAADPPTPTDPYTPGTTDGTTADGVGPGGGAPLEASGGCGCSASAGPLAAPGLGLWFVLVGLRRRGVRARPAG